MKRVFDFMAALILLILVLPVLIIFGLIVRLESDGPIFFLQERLGKNGSVFTVFKLRSMRVNPEREENQVMKNHPDVTRIGFFIRRFKIDELPQLINVLIGDMSLVGPRPCLPSLMQKFDDNAYFRLKIRPGLTGWAQVNGNVYKSWSKRWEYDRYYVENQTFLFDLKILILTIRVVLLGEKK